MKPAGWAMLTALLFVSMCTTLQRERADEWNHGYTPTEENVIQDEIVLDF